MTTFHVLGTPKPQGSKRAYINKNTGRPVITEQGGTAFADWRTNVQQAALNAHQGEPLDGPVAVNLHFTLARPKSHPKTRPTWPISQRSGDIDKLSRAILDALTYVCFNDDSQVTHLTASKTWGTPGVHITVQPFGGPA